MTADRRTALSLTGDAALGLAIGKETALAALDAVHDRGDVDLIILGADTVDGRRDGTPPTIRTIDPVSVAVARHARYPRWAFLAVAAPTRDHPYNLARRILGAHHLTGGRLGVVLADDDPGLPLDEGSIPWLPGRAPGPAVTADAALALRALWRSWPAGTIVGDRATGTYARVDQVRPIHHDGVYRIAGPLGTPASEIGDPVLGRRSLVDEPADWADIVVSETRLTIPRGSEWRIDTLSGAADVTSASALGDPAPRGVPRGRTRSLREMLRVPA